MKWLLIAFAAALPITAGAEPRNAAAPPQRADHYVPLPRNPGSGRSPCAEFGAGFVQLEGSSTCVRLGGSISVGAGTRR
uniref:Porin n=1 Tax=Rhodopseudomonas palustris (strain DX-1) TaxID=652103 RepID=E6VEG1_RHOPX